MKYLRKIFDALSQLTNTLIGGYANESLSGRSHRTGSKWEIVIDTLLWFDDEHCKNAYLNDIAYARWIIKEADK